MMREIYDTNGNGYIDQGDFQDSGVWNEMSNLADSNQDGKVTMDEFEGAVMFNTAGKAYFDFPNAFTFFIEDLHDSSDIDGDGAIGPEEYEAEAKRRNISSWTTDQIDDAFEYLVDEYDKVRGGVILDQYKEYYSRFLGNPDESDR